MFCEKYLLGQPFVGRTGWKRDDVVTIALLAFFRTDLIIKDVHNVFEVGGNIRCLRMKLFFEFDQGHWQIMR